MRALSVLLLVAALPALAAGAAADVRIAAAAKRGDWTAVRALVRQRADVNAADAEGMTALHWAARANDLETVRLLLGAGAAARVANRYGVTPLHESATGNAALMAALLKAGADPNAAYGEGETVLMSTVRTGDLPSVRLLLEAGANVNAREAWRGETPLMLAAVENHADVVRALIAAGADVNAKAKTYEFPSLTGGAGGIIHDRPQGGLAALMFAARQGASESGRLLLDAGAEINATEPQYQFTALQTAIFNGHYRFATMLVERGADVNDGALYVAIEMRNLAHYTNRPNPPAADGQVSHLDVITLLLQKGADPNRPYAKRIPPRQAQGDIKPPAGATPLYRAVRSLDAATVQLLLDHKADVSQTIGDGSTPLMAAAGLGAARGDEDGEDGGAKADPAAIVKLLVDRGADVNAANQTGNTAMHFAVQRGSVPIIELLAGKGARFDVKNKQGKTAADLARGRTAAAIAKLTGTTAPATP